MVFMGIFSFKIEKVSEPYIAEKESKCGVGFYILLQQRTSLIIIYILQNLHHLITITLSYNNNPIPSKHLLRY